MPTAPVNGLNLNYDIRGRGEPLLMIMGMGSSAAGWDPKMLDDLAKSFSVITFDHRGTGQSDKPDVPYSIEMFAGDSAGILDYLELPKAHVFGVSMGGMVAQEFGVKYPDKAETLTLGCTTAGGANSVPPPPESYAALTAFRDGLSPEDLIRRNWPLVFTAEYIQTHRSELEAAMPRLLEHPTPAWAFKRHFQGTLTLKMWDRLPHITAPTLVVTGAEDVLIPPKNSELIASRIPGAQLHVISKAGHSFFVEARDEFLNLLVPFLKAHPIVT